MTSPDASVWIATGDAAARSAGVTLWARAKRPRCQRAAPSSVAPGGYDRESVATTNRGTPSASTEVTSPPAAAARSNRERDGDPPCCAVATPIVETRTSTHVVRCRQIRLIVPPFSRKNAGRGLGRGAEDTLGEKAQRPMLSRKLHPLMLVFP